MLNGLKNCAAALGLFLAQHLFEHGAKITIEVRPEAFDRLAIELTMIGGITEPALLVEARTAGRVRLCGNAWIARRP